MASTNMDINKNKTVTVPVFEFMLPRSEVQADLAVGEFGEIEIPVEIVALDSETVTFRKNGPAFASDMFRPEPLNKMRDRIGVTDSPEKDFKEDESEDKE